MKQVVAIEEKTRRTGESTGASGTFARRELLENMPASAAYYRAVDLISSTAGQTDMRDLLRLVPQIFEGVVKIEIDLNKGGPTPLQLMSAVVDEERVFFTASSDRDEPFAAKKVPLMLTHGGEETSIGDMYVLGFRPISLDPDNPNDAIETERVLGRIGSMMAKTIDAAIDGLTAVSNRKSFDRSLAEKVARFRSDGRIFSLIIIDLDHFKKVNDGFGHQAGDRVLAETAVMLMNGIRGREGCMDTVFRIGGEEFGMILSDVTIDESAVIGERLRRAVREHDFGLREQGSGQPRQVTCSMGVADVREVFNSEDVAGSLYKLADERLYQAKNGGRDSVIGMKAIGGG